MSLILTILTLLLIFWSNMKIGRRVGLSGGEEWVLQGLWVYHVGFAGIFYWYIMQNGGDALRYWELTSEVQSGPESWMGYFGQRTDFVQWLNYIPSRVFDLEFWFGNVLYATVSFIGIRGLFLISLKYFRDSSRVWVVPVMMGIFFLPNLHFWTAGVGKEALLFLGLFWALKGFESVTAHWKLALMGILLSFWVRPVNGVILGLMFWMYCLFQQDINLKSKFIIAGTGFVVGFAGLYRLIQYMHLDSLSWEGFLAFSKGQMEFLSGFAAETEIPMESYSWIGKLWALYIRPFWGEVRDIWDLVVVLENTLALAFIILGVVGLVKLMQKGSIKSIPPIYWAGLVFTLLMGLVFSYTLNNLGIIVRMKSIYMIFCYLFCWKCFSLGFGLVWVGGVGVKG